MYNKYIKNLVPRFTQASAFLSPHTSGDTRPWRLKVAFRLWLPWSWPLDMISSLSPRPLMRFAGRSEVKEAHCLWWCVFFLFDWWFLFLGIWRCWMTHDLYASHACPNNRDKLVWIPSPKKGFQIKSFYAVLQVRSTNISHFPWKCIWKSLSPPRGFLSSDC